MIETLKKLGYDPRGRNYATLRKRLVQWEIDTSHWLTLSQLRGRHLRGKARSDRTTIPLDQLLVQHSTYTNTVRLKTRLLRQRLIHNKCYECGIVEWCGRPIVLQLDHKNGINNDHRLHNLRLLCPNCHSQTDTYCGRNIKKSSAPGGIQTHDGTLSSPAVLESAAIGHSATRAISVDPIQRRPECRRS